MVGALAGLFLAALTMAAAWLNQGQSRLATFVTNFLTSVPVLACLELHVTQRAYVVAVLLYSGLVGVMLGALFQDPRRARPVAGLVLVVLLIVAHRVAQVMVGAGLEDAIRAVVEGASRFHG